MPPLLGVGWGHATYAGMPKVHQEFGDESPEDCMTILTELHEVNKTFCDILHFHGFDGSLLCAKIQKQKDK